MNRFTNWLYRFMYGRNGFDKFGSALMWAYIVAAVLSIIVGFFSNTASLIIQIIAYAMFFYFIFRVFSRNITARRRENDWWIKTWAKTPFGKNSQNSSYTSGNNYNQYNSNYNASYTPPKKKAKLPRDRDHVYRICPACRSNIRLPKAKGEHTVRCPGCNTRFQVRI